VITTPKGYRRSKPTPLTEQHEVGPGWPQKSGLCPSWWGLLSDDDTKVCCAVCLKELGQFGPKIEPPEEE
jgi:hypothetical protein